MNSGAKTVLYLLLLGAVMFGVTVISQFSGSPPVAGTDPGGEGGDETGSITGPPLEFALTEVGYNPEAEDQLVRAFPGFFEVSPELNYQSFWFKQPHKRPVQAAVKGRSCTACTSARIGTLPADPLKAYVQQVKDGKVPPPVGPAEAITASLIAAAVSVNSQIQWQEFDFDRPEQSVTLPAVGTDGTPLTGVFQMIYKVTGPGPKTLDVYLGLTVAESAAQMKFSVSSIGMPAFRVIPGDGKLAVGDLPEGSAPRTTEVVCWSATRRLAGPGRTLPPPAVAVLPRDPFVEVGTPVPVPDADLGRVAASLAQDKVSPPVLSAYRVPVTVHRSRPANAPPGTPPDPDVGPFERKVALTVPGEASAQEVTLSGTVTGLVALTDGRPVDLGSFPSQTGSPPRNLELVSDKPGLRLAVSAAESRPKYVTIKLGEPEDRGGRRFWTLTVSVAPGVALEEFPANSVIVLTADLGDGQPRRVKLPLKGRAFTRGGR